MLKYGQRIIEIRSRCSETRGDYESCIQKLRMKFTKYEYEADRRYAPGLVFVETPSYEPLQIYSAIIRYR